jgi:hypothetical protein
VRWLRRRPPGRHAAVPSGAWLQPVHVPPPADDGPVELGFRDGSTVRLGAESPHGRALRAVADVLVAGHRGPRS